jgi:hypothetical protein
LALGFSSAALAVGAIAVDDEVGDTDPGYGFSTGHANKDEARRAAMAECKKAGNDNCKFAVWFETCGAYAASKKYYGVGWGSTAAAAKRMALEKCGNSACKIKVAECE